jgi:hypothetical protein
LKEVAVLSSILQAGLKLTALKQSRLLLHTLYLRVDLSLQ